MIYKMIQSAINLSLDQEINYYLNAFLGSPDSVHKY